MKQDEVINISTSQKKTEDDIIQPQVDLLWLNRMYDGRFSNSLKGLYANRFKNAREISCGQ